MLATSLARFIGVHEAKRQIEPQRHEDTEENRDKVCPPVKLATALAVSRVGRLLHHRWRAPTGRVVRCVGGEP